MMKIITIPLLIICLVAKIDALCQSTAGYVLQMADGSLRIPDNSVTIGKVNGLQTALDGKQATFISGTSIKTINGTSLLGSGDIVVGGGATAWGQITGTLSNQNDLATALNLKANLASPQFTGTPVVPGYLPNTSTSDIGTSPTSSSTTTITHNLGRVPAIIRIYGYGTFTSNASATATTSSMGVFNSSGNRCVYQRYGAAITTTQAALSSNTFAILLATGGGSFISGVIQNVTSSQFDIVWTETGTATAQVYLWEAQ